MENEKKILSLLSRIYVIFIVAVYPLYVGFEGYNDIVASKARLYWTVSLLFIIVFSLFYTAHVLGKTGKKKELNQTKFWKRLNISDYALIAFFLVITLSCVFSEYQNIVWLGWPNRQDGWLSYFCMIIGFFIISRWYKPQQLDFTIMAVGSTMVCMIGFLQYYGFDFLKLFPYHAARYALDGIEGNKSLFSGFTIIFRSTLGNIDFVSAYVCMSIVLFGILYIKTETKIRFFYLATSAMNFILMVIAGADAGKVAVLGALALLIPYWVISKKYIGKVFILIAGYGIFYYIHYWTLINLVFPSWDETLSPWDPNGLPMFDRKLKRNFVSPPIYEILLASITCLAVGLSFIYLKIKSWLTLKNAQKIGAGILAVLIIGGFIGVEVLGNRFPAGNIIYQAREIMHGNLDDSFGSTRLFTWKKAIARVPHGSLLGTGSDTFYYAFGMDNQKESVEKHHVVYDKAHNDFIQILLCNGIFALAAYLAFLISMALLAIKKAFTDPLTLIVFGASIAYVIQSFFGIDTIIVTPLFWIFLGILRSRQLSPESKTLFRIFDCNSKHRD